MMCRKGAARRREMSLATGVQVRLADLFRISGPLGLERDLYAGTGWLGFGSFGFGMSVGPLAFDFRQAGQTTAEAAPTALSLILEP